MNEEQQKKEVSDLKFSDFQSSGIKFDHNKDNMLEVMGIGEEEFKDMANVLSSAAKDAGSFSKAIENTINLDVPMKWKILGLLKLGEASKAAFLIQAIQKLPDDTPAPLLKAMLIMAIIERK